MKRKKNIKLVNGNRIKSLEVTVLLSRAADTSIWCTFALQTPRSVKNHYTQRQRYNSRQKSWDTLHFFTPPKQCCFLLEVHALVETFHVHNNDQCLIDKQHCFEGSGVRVLRGDEGVERAMVFHRKNERCTAKHSV